MNFNKLYRKFDTCTPTNAYCDIVYYKQTLMLGHDELCEIVESARARIVAQIKLELKKGNMQEIANLDDELLCYIFAAKALEDIKTA